MRPFNTPDLGAVAHTVYIIAHKENTLKLRAALEEEGFSNKELRGPYTEEELCYPAQIRCLINHFHAWQEIARNKGFAIVVEADFVPVRGFSKLPLPFLPDPKVKAMAWLYSVGPNIYHVDKDIQSIYGHNAGTVAYVLDDVVAREWITLFKEDMAQHAEQKYRPWEVYLPIKLRRERGVRCYIPFKMYGEHGGKSNPEHRKSGVRNWHEADCLAGSLHFLPVYADDKRWVYYLRRMRGRCRGFYRFLLGRYFDGWRHGWFNSKEDRILRLYIALSRLL